jgi:hypothetical protein
MLRNAMISHGIKALEDADVKYSGDVVRVYSKKSVPEVQTESDGPPYKNRADWKDGNSKLR